MEVFDDLEAEQDRLDGADVVLHLAQSDEAVVAAGAGLGGCDLWERPPGTLDELMAMAVAAERAAPEQIFDRWRAARRAAIERLRTADPTQPLPWAAAPLKPQALATTRLAEHWTHGLDITGPLGIELPDTVRLRHVAWLAHRSLPYAFALAGAEPAEVHCGLTGPDGSLWEYGPPGAASTISGDAGAFCRVGARRLDPEESGLVATGPHGPTALAVLCNYAT